MSRRALRHTLLVLTLIASPLAAQVQIRTVAVTGDPAPGTPGATFAAFGPQGGAAAGSPAIGPDGRVVFWAQVAGGGDSGATGVWSDLGGTTTPFVLSGQTAPGTSKSFVAFNFPAVGDGGQPAILALLSSLQQGVWMGTPAAATKAALTGEQAPGYPSGVTWIKAPNALEPPFDYPLAISNAGGLIAFNAFVSQPQPNNVGLWVGRPGALTAVARFGDPAAGLPNTTYTGFFSQPRLNARGQLLFAGAFNKAGGGGGNAIWLGTGTSLTPVAITGQPAPGTPTTWGAFAGYDPQLNDAGQIAFIGNALNIGDGIWAGSPGKLQLVALQGQPAPGFSAGHTLFEFFNPLLDGRGGVTFVAVVAQGGQAFNAVYTWRPGGGLTPVAVSGGAVPGLPSARFAVGFPEGWAISPAGDLALLAALADGRSALLYRTAAGSMFPVAVTGSFFRASRAAGTISEIQMNAAEGAENGQPRRLSNADEVVFRLAFQDGSGGVFTVRPLDPSPLVEAGVAPGETSLARCIDIEYQAFTRPNPGGGRALFLVATCSYPFAGVVLTLEGDPDHPGAFRLLQTLPQVTYFLDTSFIGSFSSGLGLQDPPSEVQIFDASGPTTVPVEARP